MTTSNRISVKLRRHNTDQTIREQLRIYERRPDRVKRYTSDIKTSLLSSSLDEATGMDRSEAVHYLCNDELFVVFKPLEYVADVIHWFETAAKAKLHSWVG
jgi:hypothetical protein